MAGANTAVTRPIRLMPPRMTPATSEAVTSPLTHGGIPKAEDSESATVFA